MLLPKYSIRALLAITTLWAVFAAVVSQAFMGSVWAMAVSLAIGSVLLAAVLYTCLFCVAWLGSQVTGGASTRAHAARSTAQRPAGGD
jgi:hypothetical protein